MITFNKRSSLLLIAWLLIIAGLTVACGGATTPAAPAGTPAGGAPQGTRPAGAPQGAQAAASPTPRVTTTKVRLIGSLVSASQATLSFASAGRVTEIKAPEGTRVKAGDLVAALDTTLLEIQIAQAQAALDLANANWNRLKPGSTAEDILIAKTNIDRTKSALDQAQTAYDRIGGSTNPLIATTTQALTLQQAIASYQGALAQYNLVMNRPTQTERDTSMAQIAQAQAALEVAKRNLNNARIVAPFDSTVIWIVPKVGESTTANTPVITFADLSKMQVQVNADETTLPTLKVGQKASITLDALGEKTLTGSVKRIGMLATTASGIVSVPVWIEIDPSNAGLYPGLSAVVEIVTGS